MNLPFLSREEVNDRCERLNIIAAVTDVLIDAEAGLAGQSVRRELAPPQMPGLLGLMPSWRSRAPRLFAAKVVCVMPQNPKQGLPAHQGICALFDGDDGHLIGLAEAGAVTEWRTAALAAIATRTLAKPDAQHHLVIGGGHQVLPHLRAFHRCGAGEIFHLWARRVDALSEIRAAANDLGIEVEVTDQLEEAVRTADVVTTLTSASEPFLNGEWLRPGTHVNAMGSSTPFVREFGDDLISKAMVFVDDRESALTLSGEFLHCSRAPAVTPIGAVLARNAIGRQSGADITLFKSVGIGIQDLALLEQLFPVSPRPSSDSGVS